jgi:hypothetical protein
LKQIPLVILLFICVPQINAQIETKIDSGLQWYYKHNPQEKIYVHTDKDQYIVGQHIWFSIYAIALGKPSEISKIIYLQLVGRNERILAQVKLPLDKGKSFGDLILPDSIPTDFYQLRCFTAWMLNFGEYSIFHKTVFIQNPASRVSLQGKESIHPDSYHFNFFPEGGDIIDGNLTKVAFKAVDGNGMPVNIRGEITDEQKNHIAPLQTIHDGMGEFSFLPHAEHKYNGFVQFNDGSTMIVQMPEIKAYGVTLRIAEQDNEDVNIAIFHHDEYPNQYQHLSLAVFQNSGRSAVYLLKVENGKNIFSIKKNLFSNGILRFTLFDSNGVPLAERVLFLQKQDDLKIELIKDSLSFRPRLKNEFDVQVNNPGLEKNDTSSLSIAVTDADIIGKDSLNNNIFSSILISSELNGYIYKPAYYFLDGSDSIKNALDLVMLTNGWRHFKWEDILSQKQDSQKYAAEGEQDLLGEIIGFNKIARNKEGLKLKILIQNEDSSKFVGYAVPDSNGKFILRDYSVRGKSTVFFEGVNKGKTKDIRVQFLENTLDSFKAAPYLHLLEDYNLNTNKNTDELNLSLQQQKGMLKAVTIRGQLPTKIEQLVSKYVSSYFREGRASTIDLVDNFYSNNNRMFDFLKGRFPGLTIEGTEDRPIFDYEGQATLHDQGDSMGIPTAVPYFYVNEVQTSWEEVKNIPFSDIALIQFLPPPVAIAPFNGGFRGVITIYLKKEDELMKFSGVTDRYNHYSFNGFSITREFYSPDYSIKKPADSSQDLRSTLYWNPHFMVGSNGSKKFLFFNSDKAKRFLIVIEGIDEQGRLASFTKIVDGN